MSQSDDSSRPTWSPSLKPSPQICPRTFCFHFQPAGSRVAPGLHENVDAALKQALPISEDQCGCSFGVCTRLDALKGDRDWYEPNEPELERAGLPWSFFMAGR
ncbi:hypothetical protein [Hyalangium rubrum]|uniref:Uncharacterized protein n=1 Tax=Hyalangium rubrum TaxID=3103134 RepID=A0ABU5H215_9BACT|nr:hypothetical protein [Hyalangium sp. s54d21]MDY7226827.1 hypothetical protein [Hyalangium sp. s54d21]